MHAVPHPEWLHAWAGAIGFWAAVLTTAAFTPQVVRTWRTGGQGLSWTMLTLFGTGVGLWFVYGWLEESGPIMLANGLTGAQVLVLLALKIRRSVRPARMPAQD